MRTLLIAVLMLALFAAPVLAQTQIQRSDLPLRLIIVKYADAADIAWLFGGQVIQSGGMNGGGGYGGGNGGNSGYGGGYGGNSGYGSSSGRSGYGGSSRGNRGY